MFPRKIAKNKGKGKQDMHSSSPSLLPLAYINYTHALHPTSRTSNRYKSNTSSEFVPGKATGSITGKLCCRCAGPAWASASIVSYVWRFVSLIYLIICGTRFAQVIYKEGGGEGKVGVSTNSSFGTATFRTTFCCRLIDQNPP